MEKMFKSPQESVAQLSEIYPYFSSYDMSDEHAGRLKKDAESLKKEMIELDPSRLPDDILSRKIGDIVMRAMNIGVWDASEGEGASERIAYVADKQKVFGLDDIEATQKATRILEKNGLKESLEKKRVEQEQAFEKPIAEFINSHEIDPIQEAREIEALLSTTIDIETASTDDIEKLSTYFSGGNYLYHGAKTSSLVKILETGNLMNLKALREQYGLESRGNSGYEGISWSMNEIDALPGDRYHLAGFLAAPELILGDDEQLAIPSRPAPNEVLQLSGDINAADFYEAKTQYELYRDFGLGEKNSVIANILALNMWADVNSRSMMSEPMLHSARTESVNDADYSAKLKKYYEVLDDGSIKLSGELLQQTKNEIPAAAVWIQAAIDNGRLKDTDFDGKSLVDVIDSINKDNAKQLFGVLAIDVARSTKIIEQADENVKPVKVPIENMYFVTSRKDAEHWMRVLSRSEHKPAGILLYDEEKVRLENFASVHRGDHSKLSQAIRSVIPEAKKTIDYNRVLGVNFNEDMRAGHRRQVIGEQHLSGRKAIKKVGGELVVEG